MKALRGLLIVMLMSVAFVCKSHVYTGWEGITEALHTDNPVHNFDFEIDSIDFRKDLTRIYGRFIGTPHVGIKIKQILLTTNFNAQYFATDTDGFDLDKYFQFEETPTFNVEIDFEPIQPIPWVEITFVTANGTIEYSYCCLTSEN